MPSRLHSLALILLIFAAAVSATAGPLRSGELLATDRERGLLVAINPLSGTHRVLSGHGVAGDGPSLWLPRRVHVTADRRIFVLGAGDNPLVEVDQLTGNRTAILGTAAGDPAGVFSLRGIASAGDNRLATLDRNYDRIRFIDLESGDSALAGPFLGQDHRPNDLVPSSGGGFYIASSNPDQIRRVETENPGSLPLLAVLAGGESHGPGTTLLSPASIAWSTEGILYGTSHGNLLNSIISFDPATSGRERVTGSDSFNIPGYPNPFERGSGPKLTSTSDLVVGLDGYLYAATTTGLIRVDPSSGDREMVLPIEEGSELRLSGLAVVPIPEPAALLITKSLVLVTILRQRRPRVS